ncbi:MAG: hypothetical protein M3156_06115 [Thermoproteota archaeon]|nr:hypothetical protein [Thermoproteota archaeon]
MMFIIFVQFLFLPADPLIRSSKNANELIRRLSLTIKKGKKLGTDMAIQQ